MIFNQQFGAGFYETGDSGIAMSWNWVSAGGGNTITGTWSNVIQCRSSNVRIEAASSNTRLKV